MLNAHSGHAIRPFCFWRYFSEEFSTSSPGNYLVLHAWWISLLVNFQLLVHFCVFNKTCMHAAFCLYSLCILLAIAHVALLHGGSK